MCLKQNYIKKSINKEASTQKSMHSTNCLRKTTVMTTGQAKHVGV